MCKHAKVLAGHLRAGTQHAVGYYCPHCNTVTYEAKGKGPLTLSRSGDQDVREEAVRRWLLAAPSDAPNPGDDEARFGRE